LKIDVTAVGLSSALRGRVVRRVLLALSRFGPRIRRVTVRLAEPANPLGGVDQRCRMRAWLQETDGIRAEAINGKVEAAVARAAAQLAHRVALAMDGHGGDGAHVAPAVVDRVDRRPAATTGRRGLRSLPTRRPRRLPGSR
jgi:hypothetical protein